MLKVFLLIVVTYSDGCKLLYRTLRNAISVLLSGVHGLKVYE